MIVLRYAYVLALVVWVGALVAAGVFVAPAIFGVLQTEAGAAGRELAGAAFGEVLRRVLLDEAGRAAVDETAGLVAQLVDELLEKRWSRREGHFIEESPRNGASQPSGPVASCACGTGIPVQSVTIDGQKVTLIALPPLMEQFRDAGKLPSPATAQELLAQVALYNQVPTDEEGAYLAALEREYAAFCRRLEIA